MKNLLILLPLLTLAVMPTQMTLAQDGVAPSQSEALCLPGVYQTDPGDCLLLGPSAYLTGLAENGMRLPLRPIPGEYLDINYAYVPYKYARVTGEGRVFASLQDAIFGKLVKRYIEDGFDFVSYEDMAVVDGKKYYMIDIGEWMRGDELNAGIATSTFVGLLMQATPPRNFGWVLFPVESQRTPGSGGETSGHYLNARDLVQVYDSRDVDGVTWHLIAPDEWVEDRNLALVYPRTTPPPGVDNGRWVEVNLYEQTVAAYEDNRMVFATMTSTGTPGFWTRPGLFQIFDKLDTTPMRGAFEADRSDYYYLEDVPWTMYFDEARALHGAYWHNSFGTVQSHGCVNLSPGDSRWLYEWAEMGDWVYVWDPSGKTPEDPALYGEGGA